jgi:hypothetical protein
LANILMELAIDEVLNKTSKWNQAKNKKT